jgi:hypothetical protein
MAWNSAERVLWTPRAQESVALSAEDNARRVEPHQSAMFPCYSSRSVKVCSQQPLRPRIIGAEVNIISSVFICLLNLLIHAFYEY